MQTQNETAPQFEALTRALGDKVGTEIDEKELHDEFQKYLEYGVPPDQAVRTILRHHGVQGGAPTQAAAATSESRLPLAEVPPNVPYVNLLVRLVTVNEKTVQARGEEKRIWWGIVGDESGTRPYTSWRPLEGLEKGDVVAVQGAYTKEFRDEVQVNFGDRCRIEKRDPEELPRTPTTFQETTVGDLRAGMRGLRVTARVLDVAAREITVQGEPKTVYGGTLADRTGKVEFTAWHDHGLESGQAVTIEGGYVRAFRGVPQFNFDQEANVAAAEGADLPPAAELDTATRVDLSELMERGGGRDVEVVASLIEVRPGSGLVFRCPEEGCSRVLVSGQCRIHGKGEGVADLRVKGVLDDGTGSVNVVAGRGLTEALLGQDLEACLAEAKEAFRHEVVQERLEERLTGRVFRVRGNVLQDEYGSMLIAQSMESFTEDVEAAAERLVADLPAEAF